MAAVCDALRAANGPLSLNEIACAAYGTRTADRVRNGRRRRVTVPTGDVSNVRRALKGLVGRGTVVMVSGHASFSRNRYALRDRERSNRSIDRPFDRVD